MTEGDGRLVVVEDDPRRVRGQRRQGCGQRTAVGDLGQAGAECLGGALDEVVGPFPGEPEVGACVAGLTLVGADEMEGGDPERSGIPEDIARRLGRGRPIRRWIGGSGGGGSPHENFKVRASGSTATSEAVPRGPLIKPASKVSPGSRRSTSRI